MESDQNDDSCTFIKNPITIEYSFWSGSIYNASTLHMLSQSNLYMQLCTQFEYIHEPYIGKLNIRNMPDRRQVPKSSYFY